MVNYSVLSPPLEDLPDSTNTANFVRHVIDQTIDLSGSPVITIPIIGEDSAFNDNDFVVDLVASWPELQIQPGQTTAATPISVSYTYNTNSESFIMELNFATYTILMDDVSPEEVNEVVYSMSVEGWPVTVYDPSAQQYVDVRQHSDRSWYDLSLIV